MRTNEERARLVHKRTAEIKRERQKKKQRALDMICIAACLILVVGIGSFLPDWAAGIPGGGLYRYGSLFDGQPPADAERQALARAWGK